MILVSDYRADQIQDRVLFLLLPALSPAGIYTPPYQGRRPGSLPSRRARTPPRSLSFSFAVHLALGHTFACFALQTGGAGAVMACNSVVWSGLACRDG